MKAALHKLKKNVVKLGNDIKFMCSDYDGYIIDVNERQLYKYAHRISDKRLLKCWYRKRTGTKLNLKKPTSLNEKMQWLKINDRKDSYTTMVDKYEMKSYVENKLGRACTIPTLGIYKSFDEIDFSALPDRFVLKATHDSGSLIVCQDKAKFDYEHARAKLEFSLSRNYYWKAREWPYKNVEPRIICEAYLENKDKSPLVDYKFYCYGGEPRYFMYSLGEAEHRVRNHKFNMELQSIDHLFKKVEAIKAEDIELPSNIGEMIDIVRTLSRGFKHIRIDLYNVDGVIYVGEFTFYSGAGLINIESKEYAASLADLITLE